MVTAASAASIAAGATTFNNVDQTTPLGVFASSVGISLSGSCTNSSASGELVITTAAWDEGMNNQSITTAGGQTELWNVSGMNYVSAAASTKTGATTVVSSYTSGDATVQEWCMGGVPIKPTSLAGSNSVVFTQAPAFQLPFSLAAGSVITITNFIGVTSGTMPANPSISATLANGGTFLTLSNAVFSSTASNLVWQGALPAAVNIAAGQALTLTIANNQAGVAFRIYYDSSNCPSKVMLPTTNIIGITSVGVYDTSGLPVSSLPQGAARYVRVTVTDPFGAYDIASATLTMVMSGAVSVVNVALSNAYVIASNGWSKTYAYAWTPAVAGTYTIFAMAREGTEGITAQASVTHTVTGAARTPASAEFTASLNGLLTATYPTNVPVYVRITDLDLNTQPGVVETNVALLTETSGDQETITVIETGTNTGVFAGSLPASTFLGQYIEDGILFAPAGSIATVTFVDPVDPADVALATATIATLPLPCKVLYLSEPSNTLDRIDPVASGDGSTTNTAVASRFTFTQAPAFGLPICMSAGDVIVITNYIGIASGAMPSNAAVIAMLSAAGSTFFTASNATYYANGGASNLAWQGTLPADVTIASNQAITLTITNAQAGVTFRILYDSTNCPSKILLPTTNVIHIASLQMYNSAGFAVLGSAINGQTLHIRTTVTDPFGSYDINRLGLTIDGPGSADDVRVMLSNAYVIASNAYAKTYDYTWITPAATGAYTITVVAYEGTEGINDQLAFIQSLTWDGDLTPSTTEFTTGLNGPVTDLYRTNETVCVRVRDYDCNTNATQVENVRVTVTNDTFGDVELLILTEVGPNSGVFTGSVPASTSAGVGATNGVLYAPIGSELLVRYQDYLDPTDVSSDLAVIPLATPALRVHKTMLAPSPDAVIIGALIQFAIRAVNAGNSTQSTVALTDTFPAGALTYLSAIPAPDTTTAGTLTWNNLGPLLPGQQADISVFFTIAATVTNTALATAGSLAATDTYVVAISGPDVTVFKTPLLTGPVAINSIVPYRIVVRNVGATRIATLPLQDIGDSYAYLSATLPPDGQGAGLLLWDNLIASGGYLNVGVAITNDVVLRAIKVGNPAVHEASVTFAYDEYG
ncbi:MAG: hypothetical protein NTV22_09930, partial [bacterium]|nr:hypothetical protein [bacterium]